jgi:hypothetical protein
MLLQQDTTWQLVGICLEASNRWHNAEGINCRAKQFLYMLILLVFNDMALPLDYRYLEYLFIHDLLLFLSGSEIRI